MLSQQELFDKAKLMAHAAIDSEEQKNFRSAASKYKKAISLFERSLRSRKVDANSAKIKQSSAIFIKKLTDRIIACDKALKTTKLTAKSQKKIKNANLQGTSLLSFQQTTNTVSKNIGTRKEVSPSSRLNALLSSSPPPLRESLNAIMDTITNSDNLSVKWEDVIGMEKVKRVLAESAIYPMLRPDLFHGLRTPPKGILLFGPPGNGKTMLAKALAHACRSTFFSLSASSLTSKWVGEGEKLVRALFVAARALQPSVIFLDEADALLTERGKGGEGDAARRIKTEFLVQIDGMGTSEEERILVLAATNKPMDLDQAVLRRMPRRIYLPLPDASNRLYVLRHLLEGQHTLSVAEFKRLAAITDGYSCSDITSLCREAALIPLREVKDLRTADPQKIRPIKYKDLQNALEAIRPSVTKEAIKELEEWNKTYGEKA